MEDAMKRFLLFAGMVALIAAPALAVTSSSSSSNGGGELGFGIGQGNVNADTTGSDTAQYLGIRGGYDFTKAFELEGQFASSSESGEISGINVDTTMRVLMVNGLYNFHPPKKEFVPYVMGGIGRSDISVDASGLGTADDNSIAYQVGGGTRIFVGKSKRMAVRMDLSWLHDNNFDTSSTNTTVTAGLTWKLGR